MARNLAALSLAFLTVAMPLFPTALLQMNMDQITAVSTEVVEGTVTGSSTGLSGQTIFTHYSVQVANRWKGAPNPTTDVALPGGTFKNLRQSFAGVPVLRTGQQYVLFLWQGKTGPNQPVGLTQGIFEVDANATGGPQAFRPATGEMMLNASHQPVMDREVRMPLTEMHARITSLVAGGAGK